MTNPIKRFFLFCSGASGTILRMKGCEVEHAKYTGIGATIFFTATLAALSGGYAMFTVFHNRAVAMAFGLLWGLIIFNLDRFIVASIRKRKIAANAPLNERLAATREELIRALPRLVLAIFISIVITRPLELKLFQVEIEGQIAKDLTLERTQLDRDIDVEFADIAQIEAETEKLRGRLVALENERNNRVRAASGELDGWGGTKNPGAGPEYGKRQADLKQAEAELKSFREQYGPLIQANEQTVNQRKAERHNRAEAAKQQIDSSRGLLKRLEALSKLTTIQHLPVFLASGFIILLFISLEIAPILVKLFSNHGPYDDYLTAIEQRVYANQQKEISDTNDQINTSVAISKQLNAARIQTELQLSQNTMASLQTLAPQEFHEAQVKIARKAIARWSERQLNRLNQTMSASQSAPSSTPPNAPQPSGSTATPASAGTGTVPPAASWLSNNGGGHHTSAGTATTARVQSSATAQPGAASTAQHTTSGPGQQSGTGPAQTTKGSGPANSNP